MLGEGEGRGNCSGRGRGEGFSPPGGGGGEGDVGEYGLRIMIYRLVISHKLRNAPEYDHPNSDFTMFLEIGKLLPHYMYVHLGIILGIIGLVFC